MKTSFVVRLIELGRIIYIDSILVLNSGIFALLLCWKAILVHQSNCKDGESSKPFPSTNSVEVVREVVSEDGLCLTQECVRLGKLENEDQPFSDL